MRDATASREWQPDTSTLATWNLLGLGLAIVGGIAFMALYAATHGGEASVSFSGGEALRALLVTLVLIAALMVLHEWVHGLAMRSFGARPSYGIGVAGRVVPYAYCTAPGHLFDKRQFLTVTLAPGVMLTAICMAGIMLPFGGWLVLPAAVHLGGCIGDVWVSAKVARMPGDMRFEDTITGVRFHPSGAGMSHV